MTRTRRRQFLQGGLALAGLGLVSGCGVFPPQTPAAAGFRRIGVLGLGGPVPTGPIPFDATRQTLSELGWVEGQNIAFEYRFAENEAGLPGPAKDLVALQVDLLLVGGTVQAQAAKQATNTIPIVMATSGEAVGIGLIDSLAHPGGNLTG